MPDELPVLYHAGGLLAISKPPRLPVHAAPGPGGSVLKQLIDQTGLSELTPVHRLDKDATGVLLFGETKALAAEVQREWHTAEKTYVALCEGEPREKHGMIDAPILENQTGKPERLRNAVRYFQSKNPGVELPPLPAPKTSAVHPAGRPSQTEYEVSTSIESSSVFKSRKFSSLEIKPRQGRMHQIRVHLAHLGHPLIVDPIYGNRARLTKRDLGLDSDAVLLDRIPLHAWRLTFHFRGELMKIETNPPLDIYRTIAHLGDYASFNP